MMNDRSTAMSSEGDSRSLAPLIGIAGRDLVGEFARTA